MTEDSMRRWPLTLPRGLYAAEAEADADPDHPCQASIAWHIAGMLHEGGSVSEDDIWYVLGDARYRHVRPQ